jgi:hypothetical protein
MTPINIAVPESLTTQKANSKPSLPESPLKKRGWPLSARRFSQHSTPSQLA